MSGMSEAEQRRIRRLEHLRIERQRLILRLREVRAEIAAIETKPTPGRDRGTT